MSQYDNATVIKKANQYFDGQVTSRSLELSDGSKVTLGIMNSGEFEFSTSAKERMEILNGELLVLLPTETNWQSFSSGDTFYVPANASFQVVANTVVDYCCTYL